MYISANGKKGKEKICPTTIKQNSFSLFGYSATEKILN